MIYDEMVKKTGIDPLAPQVIKQLPPLSAEQQKLVDRIDPRILGQVAESQEM